MDGPGTRGYTIDPVLISIILATTLAGVVSISAAAVFSFTLLSKVVERMVSLSVGLMLATSLLHALPEAFDSTASPRSLFATLLGGLLAFFVLEKLAIMRHSHHHEHDGHHHHHGHDKSEAGKAGWMILVGDGMHNFTDGILIAAAFLADPQLGLVTGLAIIAHEIPQEIGDFLILLHSGYTRKQAFVFNLVSSLATMVGGALAYFALQGLQQWLAPLLAIAAANMLYVAVADLIPGLHKRPELHATLQQVTLIALGIGSIWLTDRLVHGL